MQVLLNTDQSVRDFVTLSTHVDAVVSEALMHHRNHITRIEVHLGNENGRQSGPDDKRCTMEARLDRRPPVAVTHHARTIESAVRGAARIMAKAIEHVIGRSASARDRAAADQRV
jgi:hypothetical protein